MAGNPNSAFFTATSTAAQGNPYGTDVLVFPSGLDETFQLVTDGRVLAEALGRRLMTPTGTMPFHPDYGIDVRNWMNEAMTPDQASRLCAAIERQCEADERVQVASCYLTYTQSTSALRFELSVTTATGPFKYTLNVTQLTVDMLAAE